MRTFIAPCICTALLAVACGEPAEKRETGDSASGVSASGIATLSGGASTTGEGTMTSAAMTSTSSATSDASVTSPTGSGVTDAIKFDVNEDTGAPIPETTGQTGGCQKIDFLFVVDNSGSMAGEQESLANSFDGFITSIQNTVMAEDYHIMVIDTDAGNAFLQECAFLCAVFPECEGHPCDNLPMAEGCDAALGVGLVNDPKDQPCGVAGTHRYMVDGQPNLASTFECVAKVGTNGDGSERPMEAMVTAISSLNGPGGCNEGFLRKDALLVVTFITDEEDKVSNGNPIGWHASLVAAKVGNQQSIVVLGLIGDPNEPNAVCGEGDAQDSPRLREFAESFPFGSWGSICSSDYAPFFDAAVSVIDSACEIFEPPG